MQRRGYSLVEILMVVALLSLIFVVGFRAMRSFSSHSLQISRAAADPRKAEFDRFVGVLNDRLAQAWAYNLADKTVNGLDGKELQLLNANTTDPAQPYAVFGVYHNGAVYQYHFEDKIHVDGSTDASRLLVLDYWFTNRAPTVDYAMGESTYTPESGVTRKMVLWKIPPPFYTEAADSAFTGIFALEDATQLGAILEQHRSTKSGLMQHDIRVYNWNPQQESFR